MIVPRNAIEPRIRPVPPGWVRFGRLWVLFCLSAGCNSVKNGWLDPSILGNFQETATMEIRTSLSLEDTPLGIPGATPPWPEDSIVHSIEYPISPGDLLDIDIYELRQRQVSFQAQLSVSGTGYVTLPVVGRVRAVDLTVPEFEEAVADALQARDVLVDPEVTVNPAYLQHSTYSIFGIGVSASNDAPLRAGTFPIRRPDLRILEAINQVGGLNEFVTDIYIFREDHPAWLDARRELSEAAPEETPAASETSPDGEPAPARDEGVEESDSKPPVSPQAELIEAVIGSDPDREPPAPKSPADQAVRPVEPRPTDPYIYVNGQFVANPQYRPPTGEVGAQPMPFDTATPGANWDRLSGETSFRVIRISAERLRLGDLGMNVVVRGGDVIRIVSGEIGIYYVMGQVNRVGPFGFNAEKITLKAAIASAGGLTGLAWPTRCTVYRRVGQREQMIQVNLDRVFAGKDPDFLIRRGDIINVGTHPLAPFLQRVRALTLPNPVANVGYSFTYARNFADIDSFSARLNPHNEPDRFPGLFP